MKNVSFVLSQLFLKGNFKAHLDFTGLREKGAAILTSLIRTKKIMFTVTISDNYSKIQHDCI